MDYVCRVLYALIKPSMDYIYREVCTLSYAGAGARSSGPIRVESDVEGTTLIADLAGPTHELIWLSQWQAWP